jgi:hypothetical protein
MARLEWICRGALGGASHLSQRPHVCGRAGEHQRCAPSSKARHPATRRLLAFAVATTLIASRAPAETGGTKARRFFSARQGVGVEAPPGWSLSLHTGYANVLCLLLHPGGSRISLAADHTAAKDAATLAEQSRPGMAAQGLTVDRIGPGPRDGVVMDARSARRDQAIRQLYLVRPVDGTRGERQAIVVTLTTSLTDLSAASPAFDWVLAHLTLEAPVRPDEKPGRADDRPDGGR